MDKINVAPLPGIRGALRAPLPVVRRSFRRAAQR
jgi:hypothetical protein